MSEVIKVLSGDLLSENSVYNLFYHSFNVIPNNILRNVDVVILCKYAYIYIGWIWLRINGIHIKTPSIKQHIVTCFTPGVLYTHLTSILLLRFSLHLSMYSKATSSDTLNLFFNLTNTFFQGHYPQAYHL